jgi:5-methylcytosine-specific restriction endonuclease McrA
MPEEKRCPKCHQTRPLREFTKRKDSKDGLDFWCKKCKLDNQHNWKNKDRAHYRALRRVSRKRWGVTPRGRYDRLRTNAKRHGFPWPAFTSAEFVEWFLKQKNRCHYCGIQLTDGGLTKINIDRKDNSHGYTLENIALSCKKCNLIKGAWFTELEMLDIANKYLRKESSDYREKS